MVFWILIGIIVVVTIISGIYYYFDDYSDIVSSFLGAAGGFFASTICSILVLLVCWTGVFISTPDAATATEDNNNKKEKYQLRSIGGGDTVEGQYYIAGQIIDDERYITYMSSEKNSNEENIVSIKEAPANNSKIVEEEIEKPYVEVVTSERSVPWLFPWNISNAPTYKFHVPKDSVIADASFIKESKEAKDW